MNDQPTTPPPGPQQPHNPYLSAPQGPPPVGPPAALGAQTSTLPAQRRPRRAGLAAAVVATALVVGAGAGVGGAAAWSALDDNSGSGSTSAGAPTTSSQVVDTPDSPAPDGSVEQVAAKVLPSVVKINVSGAQGSGSGSGIILSSDGVILTNNHVVELAGDSGSLSVSFNDASTAKASILGTDPLTDTAVIKAE